MEILSNLRTLLSGNLIIHEFGHGIVSLPFAYFYYKKTKSLKLSFLVIIFSYLVDIDHLLDYFFYYGLSFNPSTFLSGNYFGITGRSIIFLHAWEWVILLGLASLKRGLKSIFTILLLSLISHLILDAIAVGSPIFYSIIYRGLIGFSNL